MELELSTPRWLHVAGLKLGLGFRVQGLGDAMKLIEQ